LESARLAYGAHAKSASRETLKALADLRKNVADETQRITQRAQDLTASLWRDLAVAAAPFVLRILPVGASNGWISIAFPLSAALFLVFSLSIQIWLNKAYFRQQSKSRLIWQQLLAPYLSSGEFKEFSNTPITAAMDTYRRARLVVGIAYIVLIAGLLLFAFGNDEGISLPPTPPAG
jgi:hypothetical protein